MKKEYYYQNIDDIIKLFKSNTVSGLTSKEVVEKTKIYGQNVIPSKKKDSILKIFFSGLLDPIVLLLVFTVIVSFIIGEYIDGIVVSFIILLDLILGTIEEYRAEKNADSLKNLIKYDVKVIRDNEEKLIGSEYLVPGDIVLLESGDKIPCDMRIISSSNLQVDESILTGESISIHKMDTIIPKETSLQERSNMLYAGSSIVTGRARAIVVNTGLNTYVGQIAETVSKIKEEKSPLTIRMERLSKQISLLIIGVAILIAIVLIVKGYSYSEIFMSVIALTVSAMPEGLPLALTMALTITSNMMIKKKVIVKKLNYVESLGSCTVIATDKTGTLTVNEQTAKIIVLPNDNKYFVSGVGYKNNGEVEKVDLESREHIEKIILHGKLNNEAKKVKRNYVGDSIDIAFQVLAEKANTYTDEYKILRSIPYESENKYSAVFYQYRGNVYCTVKGSFEVISSFCDKMIVNNKSIPISISSLNEQNEMLSMDGYRVIALASGKVENFKMKDFYNIEDIPKLTFEGMIGFIDPIRVEVGDAVKECHEAGIKVLMITGDHPLTAFSIAKELKIANDFSEVAAGEELLNCKNDLEFDKFIQNKKVFARVTPMDKLRIVESLKRSGEFVAVKGDGVNDAPAIRSGNIGISMGSGTDTAKETSSMIIMDDNLKSIVSGIELGRTAYSNIRKVCFFLLSCGLAEVLFYVLSIASSLPMPLVAIQLLWLNFVTDGFQDVALSYEKGEKNIMKRKPISPNDSIFNRELFSEVLFSGLLIGVIVFGVWYILIEKMKMDISLARGYIMVLMVFIQNIHLFNCRSETRSAFNVPTTGNPLIVLTIVCSIGLQILVVQIPGLSNLLKTKPIPYQHVIILMLLSFIILVVMEIYKKIKNKNKV